MRKLNNTWKDDGQRTSRKSQATRNFAVRAHGTSLIEDVRRVALVRVEAPISNQVRMPPKKKKK